jgi:phage host-nuclease inhibitor protein Gam
MELEEFQLEDAPDGAGERDFVINDEDQALWAMRKLAVCQRRVNTKKHQADKEKDRIDAWYGHATTPDLRQVQYFSEILTSYMLRLREEGRKSLELPDGTIKSRETPSRAVVGDLGLFLKWCEDSGHMGWVRTKQEADLSLIKGVALPSGDVYTTSDGEVIEGLTHQEGSISVSFEIN